mmetsp:Transcript_21791/g.26476  ORF Transcript_21791/g.26476 Transcript_21791/m.26476 type:complete len:463 (-) Transcript_21791:2418-3806(-)
MFVFVQKGMNSQSFILACQNQNKWSNLTEVDLSALQTQAIPLANFSPVLGTATSIKPTGVLSSYLASLQAASNHFLESGSVGLSASPLHQFGGNGFVSNVNYESTISALGAASPSAATLLNTVAVLDHLGSGNQLLKCENGAGRPETETSDNIEQDLGNIGNISVHKLREQYIQCSKVKEEIEKEAKRRLIFVAQSCSMENTAKTVAGESNELVSEKLRSKIGSASQLLTQKRITSSVQHENKEKVQFICRFTNCNDPRKTRNAKFCSIHGGGRRRCEFLDCTKATQGKTLFCIAHGGGRRCHVPECTKAARGATKFCISHGGGRRCEFPECTKGARGAKFCSSHGGGKRCQVMGCTKGALGRTLFCNMHGGGSRCNFANCGKSARGKTKFCSSHGGGSRCQFPACKLAAAGKLPLCVSHGGGSKCMFRGCNKAAQLNDLFCTTHKAAESTDKDTTSKSKTA